MNEKETLEANIVKDSEQKPLDHPVVITADHLKIIFHNQWLHTTMLFGLLGLVLWLLIVTLIDILLLQIAGVLLMMLFLVINYWRMYMRISPEKFLE